MIDEHDDKWKVLNDLLQKTNSVAYVKLIKNTKGYNWELKVLDLDINQVIELNNQMLENFGGEQ